MVIRDEGCEGSTMLLLKLMYDVRRKALQIQANLPLSVPLLGFVQLENSTLEMRKEKNLCELGVGSWPQDGQRMERKRWLYRREMQRE
jgi:hypothetical protein